MREKATSLSSMRVSERESRFASPIPECGKIVSIFGEGSADRGVNKLGYTGVSLRCLYPKRLVKELLKVDGAVHGRNFVLRPIRQLVFGSTLGFSAQADKYREMPALMG
jgi:hypothetical protein